MRFLFWTVFFSMSATVIQSQDNLCAEWKNVLFENVSPTLGKNNIAVVHIGSFENLKSVETILSLNKLQLEIPEIKVIAAVLMRDENVPPYQDLKQLYNLAIPILAINRDENSNCFSSTNPTTFIIGPEQNIINTYHNLPDYEEFTDEIQEITRTHALNGSPFYGRKPHDFQKSLLLECLAGIAIDKENERIFVSDYCQNLIIAVSPHGEILEVIGSYTPGNEVGEIYETSFNGPRGMSFDAENQKLYIADSRNNAIKVVDYREQSVKKITFDALDYPMRIYKSGEVLYISSPHFIWRYNELNGVAEKMNTDSLYQPLGIAISRKGEITFAESQTTSISSLHRDRGKRIKTRTQSEMIFPSGMAFYGNRIITADMFGNAIYTVRPTNFKSKIRAGNFKSGFKNGKAKNAMFNLPTDVALWGNTAYITDMGNGLIRILDLVTNQVSALNLTEYLSLSYRYSPPIFNLQEADTLYLPYGENGVDINFSFSGTYELDQKGFSYVTLVSRNKSLRTTESILTNRTPRFELEMNEENTAVFIDFYLFFRDSNAPEIIYKQSFTLQVPISFSKESRENEHVLNVVFDPDKFEN